MYIIGLTGGIASGKSTVSTILTELGACLVDTDKLARDVVLPGKPAWQKIVDWLGKDFLTFEGQLNRSKIGELVFSSEAKRHTLEGIIHPYILAEVEKLLTEAKRRSERCVVLDVPLLIESGWYKMVQAVWLVYTEQAIQLARLILRDKLTKNEALSRINSQLSLQAKIAYAQVVINNNKDEAYTRQQVVAAWQALWTKQS